MLDQSRLNENISVAVRMRSSENARTRDHLGFSRQSSDNSSHEEAQ